MEIRPDRRVSPRPMTFMPAGTCSTHGSRRHADVISMFMSSSSTPFPPLGPRAPSGPDGPVPAAKWAREVPRLNRGLRSQMFEKNEELIQIGTGIRHLCRQAGQGDAVQDTGRAQKSSPRVSDPTFDFYPLTFDLSTSRPCPDRRGHGRRPVPSSPRGSRRRGLRS